MKIKDKELFFVQAGIAVAEREGTRVLYELTSPKVGQACELLREFLIEGSNETALWSGKRKINDFLGKRMI